MATAIILVSNMGGKDSAITIAASKKAAAEVAGICKRIKGAKYVGVETMAATALLCEAFKVISQDWEKNPGF